jgi:hydroxymethylbilane synthase
VGASVGSESVGSVSTPSSDRTLRLGTRRSRLAMAQSQQVADALSARLDRPVELVEVVTYGDRSTAALTQIGGTGVFVTALREALLDHRVDLAVHSLKDLPTADAEDLVIAAVPPREDPRDALVCPGGQTLGELPPGSRIGTGSPRRTAQLRALGLDLEIVPIRGNVDTRIRKAVDGEVDAVVLARAGLARLGRLDDITEVLDPLQILPACGQGALAVECRGADLQLTDDLRSALEDPETRAATVAERSLLAALEAGCTAPVGGLADVAIDEDGQIELYLRGVAAAVDGSRAIRLSATGPATAAAALGRSLAADLLESGAAELMGAPA